MPVDALVGLQRGDEGKGRFADFITPEYDIIARGNGGANAGHTFHPPGKDPLVTHQLPSGFARNGKMNVIGAGVFLDPVRLKEEIQGAQKSGFEISARNLLISNVAHVVMPHHVQLDVERENSDRAQGSTKSGIRFVSSEKFLRDGFRLGDLLQMSSEQREELAHGLLSDLHNEVRNETKEIEQPGQYQEDNATERDGKYEDDEGPLSYSGTVLSDQDNLDAVLEITSGARNEIEEVRAHEWAKAIEFLVEYIGDSGDFLRERLKAGERILAEGAQGFWLDIDHGMYPYVTSTATTVQGLLQGLAIAPKHLENVFGVAKAVKSHVGGGPLVTQLSNDQIEAKIRGNTEDIDGEYGSTTGRARRIGYLDLVEVNTAIDVNGVNEVFLSKLDHATRYGAQILVAKAYLYEGRSLKTFAPMGSTHQLEAADPMYGMEDAWTDSIGQITDFDQLPSQAQTYIKKMETFTETPVTLVGVGPRRHQVINRRSET